ncbi:hypothetical protein HDU97_004103 [Phlyctochytrium planicorne]|nr:hypothetical protein HDU97_004103 [Phlyctochytrium planicorne]
MKGWKNRQLNGEEQHHAKIHRPFTLTTTSTTLAEPSTTTITTSLITSITSFIPTSTSATTTTTTKPAFYTPKDYDNNSNTIPLAVGLSLGFAAIFLGLGILVYCAWKRSRARKGGPYWFRAAVFTKPGSTEVLYMLGPGGKMFVPSNDMPPGPGDFAANLYQIRNTMDQNQTGQSGGSGLGPKSTPAFQSQGNVSQNGHGSSGWDSEHGGPYEMQTNGYRTTSTTLLQASATIASSMTSTITVFTSTFQTSKATTKTWATMPPITPYEPDTKGTIALAVGLSLGFAALFLGLGTIAYCGWKRSKARLGGPYWFRAAVFTKPGSTEILYMIGPEGMLFVPSNGLPPDAIVDAGEWNKMQTAITLAQQRRNARNAKLSGFGVKPAPSYRPHASYNIQSGPGSTAFNQNGQGSSNLTADNSNSYEMDRTSYP